MGRTNNPSHIFMDKLDELILSHDELEMVCKIQMAILLDMGLESEMDRRLEDGKVSPGFATRAAQVREKFHRERLMLMSSGVLN